MYKSKLFIDQAIGIYVIRNGKSLEIIVKLLLSNCDSKAIVKQSISH